MSSITIHFEKPVVRRIISYIYGDTDSAAVLITNFQDINDFYSLPLIREAMDFSNFPITHPAYDTSKKGQTGYVKSEVGANYIKEMLCLKPKMYSVKLHDPTSGEDREIQKAKGVPHYSLSNFNHEKYGHVLQGAGVEKARLYSICNLKGQMCTTSIEKTTLSALDNKRVHMLSDVSLPDNPSRVFTRAYGYYDLPENQCQMRRAPQTTTSNSDTSTHNAGGDTLSESSDEDVSSPGTKQAACNLWRKRFRKYGMEECH